MRILLDTHAFLWWLVGSPRLVDGQEQISKPDELRKAKNHCERAMYDAAEAGILYAIWFTLSSGDRAPVSQGSTRPSSSEPDG